MKQLEDYRRELEGVKRETEKQKGIGGSVVAWAMMIIGVIVTGTMTYSLARRGMESSVLWRSWVDIAAALPVGLLEGTAIFLTYGNHYWFRSSQQRRLAKFAGWFIWGLLGVTAVVHFGSRAAGSDSTISRILDFYASYFLPLSIVGAPMLWKRLYDLAPESQIRIQALENEAAFKQALLDIDRDRQNADLDAIREAIHSPVVKNARLVLRERAEIEHAKTVAGFIDKNDDDDLPKPRRSGPVIRRSTDDGYVNGSSDYPQ